MKIEQIQYVLAVYETGSISKAAKKFYMSRPNMSNAIRNLEQELGFEICERAADGVRFTQKGLELVRRGVIIMKEIEGLRGISENRRRPKFGIVNPNCPPVEQAFIKFCRQAEKNRELDGYSFSMYQEYQYEGMRLLNQGKADLAITVSKDLNAPLLSREIEERGLEYRKLWDVPCNVNMSKKHPLASEPDFSLQKLRDYPFVMYAVESDRGSPYDKISEVSFIDLSKYIRVDSGYIRSRIIAETNAYGVGVAMPPEWARKHQLHCVPIPGFTMEMGYMRRAGQPMSEAERQFLSLLSDEMSFLGENGSRTGGEQEE